MDTAPSRASCYLISIWVDRPDGERLAWRGALVTAAEQRLYFSTLAELNHLLGELAGWQDPPQTALSMEESAGPES
jgi:hypothetical protein